MSVKRKLIAIACIVTAIVISVIISCFIFLPTSPIDTTISEVVSNPEAWVNKKVRVNGTMIGPFIYIPERVPPYNYGLQDKNNRTIEIGVLYSGEVQENSPHVTVIGIVKAGYTSGLQGGDLVYYIEAEKVSILVVLITYEDIGYYKGWIWNKTNSSYSFSNNTYELQLRANKNDTWESVIIQQGILPHSWTYLNNPLKNDYHTPLSPSEGSLFFRVITKLGNWGFYGENTTVKTYMNKTIPVIKIGLACYLEISDGYQETDSRQLCVDKLLFIAYRENETTYIKDKDEIYWSNSTTDNDYHAQYLDRLLENETWVDLNVDFGEILRKALDYYSFKEGKIRCVQVYAEGVNAYCDFSVSYAHMRALRAQLYKDMLIVSLSFIPPKSVSFNIG